MSETQLPTTEQERNVSELIVYPYLMYLGQIACHNPNQRENSTPDNCLSVYYHPDRSTFVYLDINRQRAFLNILAGVAVDHTSSHEPDANQADTIQYLKDGAVLVPAEINGAGLSSQEQKGYQLSVYFQVTEGCTFHCPGCATGFDRINRAARTMDEDTVTQSVAHVVASAVEKNANELTIKWAGGEPLTHRTMPLIEAGQQALAHLREVHPTLAIHQIILTNGSQLADQRILDQLREWGVPISISLWGVGDENFRARGIQRSAYSYERIVRGIGMAHNAGLDVYINHVLTPSNASQFPDLIRTLWDIGHESYMGRGWTWRQGSKPIPLNVMFFRPQTAEQLEYLTQGGYAQMVNGLQSGFEVIHQLIERDIPIPPLNRIDYLRPYTRNETTCGAGHSFLAIGPNGVRPCHEMLASMPDSATEIPQQYEIDAVWSKPDQNGQLPSNTNVDFGDIHPALARAFALHAGAGCPLARLLEHGDANHTASVTSQIYAKIFREWLALEAFRRLRSIAG